MSNITNTPTPRAAAPEETSLGRVGLLNRGEYDSLATYKAGDFCLYGISTWLCKLDGTTGIAPVEGANWQYLAQGSADSSITVLDKATATVAQVKAAISAGKIPVCTDADGSIFILSATDDGSNYTVQFMEAIDTDGTRTVGTYYRTVLSSPDSTVIFSDDQNNVPAIFEGDLDNSVVTDTYGVSEDNPSDLPAKVTVKKMFNGVGNWIANKLVHTDAFQTVLKQYLVNNGTTTNEGFGLDARYGKNLQDQVSTLNANKVIKKTYTNITTDRYGFFNISELQSDISNGYSIISAFAKDAAFDQNGSNAFPVFSVDNAGGVVHYGYLYEASGSDITILSGALNVTMVVILSKL